MVQKHVLDEIDDQRLSVYVVWGPMLGDEKQEDTSKASSFLHDARTSHFWTPSQVLAETFRAPAGLPEGEAAWDTFHLFSPDAEWGQQLPEPVAVMHVEKPLPDEQRFNGVALRERIRALLPAESPAVTGN